MRYILTILLFSNLLNTGCHKSLKVSTAKDTPQFKEINHTLTPEFPKGWVGTWKGSLEIIKGQKIEQSIPAILTIAKRDKLTYDWGIQFNPTENVVEKPYTLKILDAEKGHYLIDEQNSIAIESYLFQQKLVCLYDVVGSLIMASYEWRNGQIIFEIIVGKDTPVSETGNTIYDGEDIPLVSTFPLGAIQRAVFNRVTE